MARGNQTNYSLLGVFAVHCPFGDGLFLHIFLHINFLVTQQGTSTGPSSKAAPQAILVTTSHVTLHVDGPALGSGGVHGPSSSLLQAGGKPADCIARVQVMSP